MRAPGPARESILKNSAASEQPHRDVAAHQKPPTFFIHLLKGGTLRKSPFYIRSHDFIKSHDFTESTYLHLRAQWVTNGTQPGFSSSRCSKAAEFIKMDFLAGPDARIVFLHVRELGICKILNGSLPFHTSRRRCAPETTNFFYPFAKRGDPSKIRLLHQKS